MIETERLRLRLPRLEDAEGLMAYFSDPVAMEFIDDPADDLAVAVAAVKRWLRRWAADGLGFFAIDRLDDGLLLGRTGLLVWDRRTWRTATLAEAGGHGQVELGWSLVRAHWGLGYATEAARAARTWGYEQGVESLVSLIHPDNVRSTRVAEKLDATPTETIVVEGKPAVVWRHPPA